MQQHHIAPLPGMKASNGSSNIYTTLPEYLTAEIIWKVFPICFIVLGTIGNILCFLVLMKKRNRQLRGSLYLIVLAFADITVLYSGLLREWLLRVNAFELDLREISEGMCKLNLFFTYFSTEFSSWLLLAITFDRVVIIFFPYCVKQRYAKFSSAVVITCIAFVVFGINAHLLWGNGKTVISHGNFTQKITCGYKTKNYKKFIHESYNWINLVLQFIFPYVALTIGNILIILKMKSLQKKVQPNLRKGCTDTTAVKSQPTTSLFSVKEGVKKTISYEDNDVNGNDDNYENERKKKVMFSPKKDSVVIEILKDISIKDGTSTIIFRQETYIKDEINKNVFETEEPCNESTSNVILKLEKKLPENGKSNDKCFEEERDETLLKIEYNLEKRININSSPRADSGNQAISGKDKTSHGNEENNRTVGETSNVPRLTDLGKDFHQPCTVKLNKVFPLPSISTEINKTDVTDEINQVSPEVNDKSELSDKTVRSFSKAENRQRAQLSSPKNHNNKKSNNKEKNKKATGFSVSLKRMKLNRKPSSYSFAVSRNGKVNALTKTLLILNTAFLVCNAPIGIFQVSRQRFSQNATQQEKAELTLWLAIINMFMYFNYTFNFLFYCLSGTKFREDLKQMFSQCKKQKRF